MDRATAVMVLKNCSSPFDPLNDIPLDRSPDLSDEGFSKLRHHVGEALACIFDLPIEPAIAEHPILGCVDKVLKGFPRRGLV
jgi:hypothetical protein